MDSHVQRYRLSTQTLDSSRTDIGGHSRYLSERRAREGRQNRKWKRGGGGTRVDAADMIGSRTFRPPSNSLPCLLPSGFSAPFVPSSFCPSTKGHLFSPFPVAKQPLVAADCSNEPEMVPAQGCRLLRITASGSLAERESIRFDSLLQTRFATTLLPFRL